MSVEGHEAIMVGGDIIEVGGPAERERANRGVIKRRRASAFR